MESSKDLQNPPFGKWAPPEGFPLPDLLPPTFRTQEGLIAITEFNMTKFLKNELSVLRLEKARSSLWMSGRLVPPRPLQHQVLLRRNLVITELPELHLVWSRDRIFIKPLPSFLLCPSFWKEHLCTRSAYTTPDVTCESQTNLAKAARGLLYSYTALINHHSDFKIAKDHGLIPESIDWPLWDDIARDVVNSHSYSNISPRYHYGELRLGRLNQIYRFRHGALVRGFSRVEFYSVYADFFAANFGMIAVAIGYVAIVLTAMQVGLATNKLESNDAFQRASYGFTVFSIIAPLGAIAAILFIFVCLLITNWDFARRERDRRLGAINQAIQNER